MMIDVIGEYHYVAQPYLGIVAEAFLLTPRGYTMAAKGVAWTVIVPRMRLPYESEITTQNIFISNCLLLLDHRANALSAI